MPLLGDTDSPRLAKYSPKGTMPLPSQGSVGEANGDHADMMGMPAYSTEYADGFVSVHTSDVRPEAVLLAAE